MAWVQVWDYAVRELGAAAHVRLALDDPSTSVVCAALATAAALCCPSPEEALVAEAASCCPQSGWPGVWGGVAARPHPSAPWAACSAVDHEVWTGSCGLGWAFGYVRVCCLHTSGACTLAPACIWGLNLLPLMYLCLVLLARGGQLQEVLQARARGRRRRRTWAPWTHWQASCACRWATWFIQFITCNTQGSGLKMKEEFTFT